MPSNYPPDWDGSADSGEHEDCLHIDRGPEIFTSGLQAMREMLARFVEQGGDTPCKALAQSIRLNWNPSWGDDPGQPEEIANNWDACL